MESQLKVSIFSRDLKILLISVYGIKKIAYTGLEAGVLTFFNSNNVLFAVSTQSELVTALLITEVKIWLLVLDY